MRKGNGCERDVKEAGHSLRSLKVACAGTPLSSSSDPLPVVVFEEGESCR